MSKYTTNEKLKFRREKMVEWYSVPQLINTGVKTILSSIFGAYSDKREIQSAMYPKHNIFKYKHHQDIWVDYVADLADGFDSTFTVARLLAMEEIRLNGKRLKRGDILIMGGDQVYPSATREEYGNRLKGPYELALPRNTCEGEPHLFAIPGNHDWYDGLTNFLKIFCQERHIGGWKTKQDKSYFALQLPHNCWILGIDIQLEADIDKPQLDYFERVLDIMQPGDKVILCSAEPSWVYAHKRKDHSYENLKFFEEKFITKRQINLVVSIAGDLHHYARYQHHSNASSHKITSGGGGAFLHPTHNLPHSLERLREGRFKLIKTFPHRLISRGLAFENLLFPLLNKQFSLFMGLFFLFITWMLQSTTRAADHSFMISLSKLALSFSNFPAFINETFNTLTFGPIIFFLFALLVFGMYKFADKDSGKHRWLGALGFLHGLVQISTLYVLIWVFSRINISILNLALYDWRQVLLFSLEMTIIGGIVSSLIMGIYLLLSNLLLGIHDNEAFSSLKEERYKNFLRMHFTRDKITIYPIGITDVVKWHLNDNGLGDHHKLKPELIEEPIEIKLT